MPSISGKKEQGGNSPVYPGSQGQLWVSREHLRLRCKLWFFHSVAGSRRENRSAAPRLTSSTVLLQGLSGITCMIHFICSKAVHQCRQLELIVSFSLSQIHLLQCISSHLPQIRPHLYTQSYSPRISLSWFQGVRGAAG